MPQLVVSIAGAEIKRLNLIKDRTTLGRQAHNDIFLSDMTISGSHCVFELEGLADVYLEDLGSTNGTYLNGKMIHRERARLNDKDVIGVGRFKVQFLRASGEGDFGQTSAMPLESMASLDAPDAVYARLRILSGSSAGLEVPVVKAVTTFGRPGIAVVAISHRRSGYFVSVMEGGAGPTINGEPIGSDGRPLLDRDELELAGTRLRFLLRE
jgi:pSer/pThr/pTyr-binding forkhead associated (FHA) protein